jgi:hypothetical protein
VALVIVIDVLTVSILVWLTATRGLERALPFFVFALVLIPKESQIALPGLFLLTTWRILIATIAVLFFFFKGSGSPKLPAVNRTPLKTLIALHVIWSIISTAASVYPVDSAKQVVTMVLEYYLTYYIVVRTVTSTKTVDKLLAAMLLGVGIASVFGLFEAYTDWRITEWFPVADHDFVFGASDEGRGNRILSTFSNYSLFGAAISFAIIELFYFLQTARHKAQKALLWGTMALMFWVIYKTVTRGPWMALIIGAVLLLLCCPGRTRWSMAVIASLCVTVFIVRPGVWDTVKGIYLNTVNTDDPNNVYASSYEYRWALWDVGSKALAKDGLREAVGYGLGTFYDLHLVAAFNGNPEYHFDSCDEAWVHQMVETGYVGLGIISLVLIVPALRTLYKIRKVPKPQRYLCWILFINMIQYFFMMTNVDIYGWGQTGYMLWVWIAIAMVYPALVQRETQAPIKELSRRVELQPEPGWYA